MNWGDDASIEVDEFLIEWERTTQDRSYQPATGDSSNNAAARFIDVLVDFELDQVDVVVVVAHGGVTVDALRTIVGDKSVINANADLLSGGVPSCAITRLQVDSGVVTTIDYPSTNHLDRHLGIDQGPGDK